MLSRRSARVPTTTNMTTPPERTGRIANNLGRIGIVAGGGVLPLQVAESAARAGNDPFIVMLDGEVEDPGRFSAFQTAHIQLEQAAALLPLLRQNKVQTVVLAGSVARRPKLRDIQWDLRILSWLPRVAKAIWQGDNVLLSALIGIFERHGMKVVGAHEIAPTLLAAEGVLTTTRPSRADQMDIEAARAGALAIGELDIGQAAVSVGGRVIALEGIEGTEGLLERVVALRAHGRLAGKTGGVLAKICKPQQDMRADLPSIGPRTVELAKRAQLAGIVVDAGRSLVLEGPELIRLANENGLFVLGFPDRPTS